MKRRFRWAHFFITFFGLWGMALFLHFLLIVSGTAWMAILNDATRAFSIVTRPKEVLMIGAAALIFVLIFTFVKLIFVKKEK